jgi:signal transduction histidine kinase
MPDPNSGRTAVSHPVVGAPPPFVDRRVAYRRAEDRLAHRETTLLAHSLDILAMDIPAEMRLAGVLDLLARTVGARRAAVLAGGHGDRRIAVASATGEPPDEAEALGAWLDAWAPRSRAQRAAAGPAPILVVSSGAASSRSTAGSAEPTRHYACLPIPAAGEVALGFDFADEADAAELAERLPPQLARHAAVALALVSDQLATERDLDALRAREVERDRFVSTVAHELRTPLTGLSGYLELILAGQVGDPVDEHDFLERSRQIVEQMGELVGDLLELSRLESGSLRLEVGPFSLTEVATRVVENVAPIALERALQLRTSLPPRLRSATGDRRRSEQIVTNLLANAMKFAPAGSVVELAAWFDGPLGFLAVRDEGLGIQPEERDRIFDRFVRLAGHERITGTGLGLPIARELALAMGGALEVASVPGSGSSFVLVLPGLTGADADRLQAGLADAIAAEEVRIEERAVLRAMAAGPRPRLVMPSPTGQRDATASRPARPRLRAIDGRGTPNAGRAPA